MTLLTINETNWSSRESIFSLKHLRNQCTDDLMLSLIFPHQTNSSEA